MCEVNKEKSDITCEQNIFVCIFVIVIKYLQKSQSCFGDLCVRRPVSFSLSLSGPHVMTADCIRSRTPDVADKSSLEVEKPLHFWHEEFSEYSKMSRKHE